DKGMPAFPSLNAEQIMDIAQFLHMRVELSANRGLYQSQNVVTGDPKKGEAYFNGSCKSCHSPTGDLAKIGSKFAPDMLQNRLLWPAGGFRGGGGTPKKVIVTLASGETVTGTLKQLDDFNVSLYDASGNYRWFKRDERVKIEVEDRLVGHRQLLAKYTDADVHNLTAYLVTLK